MRAENFVRPMNFTLGLRLQNKKKHDVDRLMVSVMSFIVYGGVSDEGVMGILVLFRRERTNVLMTSLQWSGLDW